MMMEKKSWGKPEVGLIQFAANEYVTACTSSYTAKLWCALPNDPEKPLDGYNGSNCAQGSHVNGNCPNGSCQSYGSPQGWHGTCANGSGELKIENGAWTGSTWDDYSYDIWDVQVGEYIGQSIPSNYEYNFANGIGNLIDSFVGAGYYLVSWVNGHLFNSGNISVVPHYGVAYITNPTGTPNRS